MGYLSGLRLGLDWTPPSISVQNLKPGDTQSTTITVQNNNPVAIELASSTAQQGELFAGSDPLDVEITLSPDDACTLNPNALPPGATATATVTASLPMSAGNEYQGRTGSVVLTVTATESTVCDAASGPSDDAIASTGIDLLMPLLAAVALIAFGTFCRRARPSQKRRVHA